MTRKAFALFTSTDGITLEDLQRVSIELGENLSIDELKELIDEADSNGDSKVSYEDFKKIIKKN